MDPNQGTLSEESPESINTSEVIPVCDRGSFNVTNADKDEDE